MRSHTTITLPRVRADQLKAIAARHGSTVPQLLDAIIKHELERLGMADDPPPGYYTIPMTVADQRVVHFGHADFKVTILTLSEAHELADAILACASVDMPGTFEIETERAGRHVQVRKQGRGVSLHVDDAAHGMTPAIAIEVARAILRAAGEAELLPDGIAMPTEKPTGGRALELWEALQRKGRKA